MKTGALTLGKEVGQKEIREKNFLRYCGRYSFQKRIFNNGFHVFISILLVFLSATLSKAGEINAQSTIKKVTVFPGTALVERETTVKLIPGVHKIIIENLPGGVVDDSVRGWGKGTAKVKMLGVGITRKQLVRASDEEINRLQDKIEGVKDKLNEISQEKYILEIERTYLENVAGVFTQIFGKGIITGGAQGVKLAEMERILGSRLEASATKRKELEREERRLRRELETLEEELKKKTFVGQSENKTISVDVECLSGGNFDLSVSYLMNNAGWEPVYDIRVDSNKAIIEIVTKASVNQKTGEDWKQIELILSTALPQVSGEMPEPVPLLLKFYQPPTTDGYPRGGRAGLSGAAAPKLAESPPEEMPLEAPTAEVVTTETALEYKIAGLKTISADGKPLIVTIGKNSFSSEFRYITVPRENLYAYLQAKVKNTSENSFRKGTASVFMGGKFIGRTVLPQWSQGEQIDLSLGIDEGIQIRRKLISKKADTSLGKTTITYEWEIEATNNLQRAVSLRVYEAIPQSRHSDIDVKVFLQEPQPTEMEGDGKARWDLNLQAGQKVSIRIGYKIKYPSGKQVENLP